jgi:hypothetical protein
VPEAYPTVNRDASLGSRPNTACSAVCADPRRAVRSGPAPGRRLAFVTLLSRAAEDAELPADPEFRAAIMGYADWGTRLAVHNSQPRAQTIAHAPVPRWGWGMAPPYQPAGDSDA